MGTPDWKSLWGREPALRPTHTYADGTEVWFEFAATGDAYTTPHYHWKVLDKLGIARFFCGVVDGNANCRDAAVRWLTERQLTINYVPDEEPTDHPWAVHCDSEKRGDHTEYDFWYGWHATLDDALFAACKAILDNQDAHPPTPART